MKYKGKKIKSLVDVTENVAQMQLFGAIGEDIDGNRFARDIIDASMFGFAEVKININSVGGSIFEGFSILNAMNVLRMGGTKVSTSGVGVMDSMAGIVLAFGDRGRRTATSFSSGVIHEPLFQDGDGKLIKLEELPDGELKTEARFMRDALLTSLVGSTGNSRGELKRIMSEGTRRDAKALKAIGMIDNVVTVSNEVDIKNMSPVELMAACSKIVISPKNKSKSKTMSLVNKKLGLNSEASESAQAEAVQKIIDRAEKAEAKAKKVGELETQIQTLKDENTTLKTDKEAADKALIEQFVDAQIEAEVFKKEDREKLVAQATENFEGFKTFVGSLNGNFVDVTKKLAGGGAGGGAGTDLSKEKLVAQAKEYHKADCNEALPAFKNKVGEKAFEKIEAYYVEHMEEIVED